MCQVTMKAPCRLIKAGALHKRHAARVTNISAWAEVLGYACSVVSKSLQLQDLIERERLLSQELAQHSVRPISCPAFLPSSADTVLEPCRLARACFGSNWGGTACLPNVCSPSQLLRISLLSIFCSAEVMLCSLCSIRRPTVHAIRLTWAACAEL